MPVKLPACEPCRAAKTACDHATPCTRCLQRGIQSTCSYRARPFKKRRVEGRQTTPPHNSISPTVSVHSHSATPTTLNNSTTLLADVDLAEPPRGTRNYPNPGFLGSSSHTTFFEHLPHDPTDRDQLPRYSVDEEEIRNGSNLIDQIHRYCRIKPCVALLQSWISTGVNLALAGPLIETCAQATENILDSYETGLPARAISQSLFRHSSQQLNAGNHQTITQWATMFGVHNARWEMIGLFFSALAAAAMHTAHFEPLYRSHQAQRDLQKLAVRFSDRCLDIALSLDRLNDLQLMLQYENWISHSCLDGDQSYVSWRKLGDVISSLYALGYQERTGTDQTSSLSLQSLRELTFGRAFSADRNVSLFLGRPPRVDLKHCRWLPRQFRWSPDAKKDHAAGTQWAVICAILKIEAVDLFYLQDYDEKVKRAMLIRDEANLQWSSLPSHFRLETSLKNCTGSPVERDFLLSTRLEHLHVHFLLHLQLQVRIDEPEPELVAVASEILSLVTEAVLLKETLANSGTSLDWKVAYYGLAAAGIICLSLLKQNQTAYPRGPSKAQMIQDLNVLVALVETGAFVHPIDANYALLSRATVTIKSLLRRLVSRESKQQATLPNTGSVLQEPSTLDPAAWNLWDNHQLQDFEVDFWLNLAEHPFLNETPSEQLPTTQD